MIEWEAAARIESPFGTLQLNDPDNGTFYALDPSRCSATRNLRVTSDPVPQGDGEILHARFAEGIEFNITAWLMINRETPACDAVFTGGTAIAREMSEELGKHLGGILNGSGRYFWQPSDYGDERMMDEARWLVPLETTLNGDGIYEVTFGIDCPFPYLLDKTQTTETIAGSGTLTNSGNVEFWPVIIVDGPASVFTITNDDTGEVIRYVGDDLPEGQDIGPGDIAEIDTFRNTIYLGVGGTPGDDDNLKAGVDVLNTDFWPVIPGTTNVTVAGATAHFLLNNSWLP